MKICSPFILLLFISFTSLAQTVGYEELLSATAKENGTTIINAFCGGINSIQPNHADLNNDGKKDLIIWDNNSRTLKTFINTGPNGWEQYKYAPKYAKNFPPIVDYLKLIDYNCDNIPDLFHRGFSGVSVSYGSYNSNNELVFTFYRELYFPGSFGMVNVYVQPNDIPIIEDIDRDGDLDVVSFDVLGAYAPWYKNMRVEDNLPCDSMRMKLEDNCFGKMYQTFFRTHQINASCKGIGSSKNSNQRHSGNCILAIDVNGDNLYDLIGGNLSFNDAQLLINGGTLANPLFTSQDSLYDADGHQLDISSWPSAFYFDIDNDNDKDLVFTPHIDNINTANYNAVAVYKNIGTTAVPNFKWRGDSALVKDMIDVGRNSHPTLFDYDKDGKPDLFLGGEGYFNTATKNRVCQLAYYRNTSTIGQVSFELITKDFMNLSAKNYRGIYPTFGDITGDSIIDLVLGNDSGTIAVYNNIALTNAAPPIFVWQTDSLPGVDVGNYSFPVIYDFNGDNKSDLLIGNEIGTLTLYLDTSITTTKEFKRIDSTAGDVKAGSIYSYFSYGVPYIGSVDSTGKQYLLIGSLDGTIERYDSFDAQVNKWVRIDSNMAQIQTAFRSAPAIADLDGDQRPDLLIGSQNGGLQIFQYTGNISSGIADRGRATNDRIDISIYPNPATNELWIKAPNNISKIEQYTIRDLSGRIILSANTPRGISHGISIAALREGFYFIEISFGADLHAFGKFLKKN